MDRKYQKMAIIAVRDDRGRKSKRGDNRQGEGKIEMKEEGRRTK